jgi:plasmid stability protein
MATLHVRNVPDELYEQLRAAAADDDRSIGAEAIALLRYGLLMRGQIRGGVERAFVTASPFKRRFAERAKEIVLRAQELARAGGSAEVLPAHVLQAMLEDDVLRPALERGGVTDDSVTAALPSGARPGSVPPPVSVEARRMLENALIATLDAQP